MFAKRGLVAGRIEIDPPVMLGKPVIRNSRVSVELMLRKLAEGASVADLLDAYPKLGRGGYPGLSCLCRLF